jgi:hypothetical protein
MKIQLRLTVLSCSLGKTSIPFMVWNRNVTKNSVVDPTSLVWSMPLLFSFLFVEQSADNVLKVNVNEQDLEELFLSLISEIYLYK